MDKSLIKTQYNKITIEKTEDSKRIIKIKSDSPHFKSAELMEMPIEFKKLPKEDKVEALREMEKNNMPRNEMAYHTGYSESRISQLIGTKREKETIYIEFEPIEPITIVQRVPKREQ